MTEFIEGRVPPTRYPDEPYVDYKRRNWPTGVRPEREPFARYAYAVAPRSTSDPRTTWAIGTAYAVGATVQYGGWRYECVHAHTSAIDATPPATPALWLRGAWNA